MVGDLTYIAAAHAGIYALDNANPVGIGGMGTAVQVTDWDANSPYAGPVPDSANSHITIDRAGVFFISVSATVNSSGGGGTRFEMSVQKNNGDSEVAGLHCNRNMSGGGGESGVISMSGMATLAAADTIEVWIENETDGNDYVVEDIELTVMRISH